jgi:acid phosphatase type 7
MSISRTALAAAAIVLGPTYLLLAQPAPSPGPIGILLAAGDISTCDKPNKKKQDAWLSYADKTAQIIRDVIKDAKKENPEIQVRVLALGDLAYRDGTAKEFRCFAKRWSGFEDVLLPVPGNHEYHSVDAEPYFTHFENNAAVNQSGDKLGYFALNFPNANGPWRLIGLNDNFETSKKEGYPEKMAAQITWLKGKLDMSKEENQPRCVLAFWHQPTFTSGKHGHKYKTAPNAPLTTSRPMQTALGILYDHGASVVVAGHDHNYEQFKPHDANGNAKDDGIRSFVVGTGGALLTTDGYLKSVWAPNSEGGPFGEKKGKQGVLKIDLFDNWYRWEFLSIPSKDGTKMKLPLTTTKGTCRPRK